jgi:hypothetical protein
MGVWHAVRRVLNEHDNTYCVALASSPHPGMEETAASFQMNMKHGIPPSVAYLAHNTASAKNVRSPVVLSVMRHANYAICLTGVLLQFYDRCGVWKEQAILVDDSEEEEDVTASDAAGDADSVGVRGRDCEVSLDEVLSPFSPLSSHHVGLQKHEVKYQ